MSKLRLINEGLGGSSSDSTESGNSSVNGGNAKKVPVTILAKSWSSFDSELAESEIGNQSNIPSLAQELEEAQEGPDLDAKKNIFLKRKEMNFQPINMEESEDEEESIENDKNYEINNIYREPPSGFVSDLENSLLSDEEMAVVPSGDVNQATTKSLLKESLRQDSKSL